MPKFAITFGILLILLGLVAFFGSNLNSDSAGTAEETTESSETGGKKKRSAVTGLAIPAGFGVLLLACGVIGLRESARKHAMHAAAMVGLLGAVATIGKGSYDLYKLSQGLDVNPRALTFVWIMAVLCSLFVGLCVKSFIDARKKRELEEAETTSPAEPN